MKSHYHKINFGEIRSLRSPSRAVFGVRGGQDLTRISARITIVTSYLDPNKLREYFISKHLQKTLIALGKQISSTRMILCLL